jgi:hypothetical protein
MDLGSSSNRQAPRDNAGGGSSEDSASMRSSARTLLVIGNRRPTSGVPGPPTWLVASAPSLVRRRRFGWAPWSPRRRSDCRGRSPSGGPGRRHEQRPPSSIGAGWYDTEHLAYGVPFASANERFND